MIKEADLEAWPYNVKSAYVDPAPRWREVAPMLHTATIDKLKHVSLPSIKLLATTNLFQLLTPDVKLWVKERLGMPVDDEEEDEVVKTENEYGINTSKLIREMQDLAFDPNTNIQTRAMLLGKLADFAVPKAKSIDTEKKKRSKMAFTVVTGVPEPVNTPKTETPSGTFTSSDTFDVESPEHT